MTRPGPKGLRAVLSVLVMLMLLTAPAGGQVVTGNTWYTDGTRNKSGPPATELRVYAEGALQDVAYMLVLGDSLEPGHSDRACPRTLQVLNSNVRFANSSGFIPTTVGTVTYGVPGTYQICFKDNAGNTTGTGGATFTIL